MYAYTSCYGKCSSLVHLQLYHDSPSVSTDLSADADGTRTNFPDVDGQPVECAHARLVDDLLHRAVLPEGLMCLS